MKLYLAGTYAFGIAPHCQAFRRLKPEYQAIVEACQLDRLESYHYVRAPHVATMRRNKHDVFLDSGAYSAFTSGASIDLETYARFIRDNGDVIRMASVLDAIGDAKASWHNQKRLEALGVDVLPCFHYGEDDRYLEYYIDNYAYITIGGMVMTTSAQLVMWLDRIWEKYLTHADGTPRVKVHGFGLTSVSMMTRYPWHSVDSSTWIQLAKYGEIYHPAFGRISASSDNNARKVANRHVDNFKEPLRSEIYRIIDSVGFSREDLASEVANRAAFSIVGYEILQNKINENKSPKFTREQPTLF